MFPSDTSVQGNARPVLPSSTNYLLTIAYKIFHQQFLELKEFILWRAFILTDANMKSLARS
jgi:hypothetical protein